MEAQLVMNLPYISDCLTVVLLAKSQAQLCLIKKHFCECGATSVQNAKKYWIPFHHQESTGDEDLSTQFKTSHLCTLHRWFFIN
ncbi:hypothetical protein COB55_00735 [Candidatus Wolfebacteria bacterium]|nr:MAG: hypothetical protein COB55_00735 [Candidatus Wolfebacteria bacterium]